ncbi:MAG: DUF3821 domain-containing protein [Methanoregulaceae archaeon]|nr:DUF3821 domain-containing protein [Methanoregulaceae archaeon]
MKDYYPIGCIVCFIALAILAMPVTAAINTIPLGGTAFIGEEGLDIRATGVTTGSTIAWFGNANVQTGAPPTTYLVDDAGNYYIAPTAFTGKTGPWYTFPGRKLAFYVDEPSLTLQIYDESLDFQVVGTTRWVPKGDSVGFRIVSNIYQMKNRPGVASAPVTIRIRSPDGAEYTSVSGNSLVDIPVGTSPYSTGPVWNTGSYPSGTYSVWAECNANSMKDNYDIPGKTHTPVEPPGNLLIQSVNPLITSSMSSTTVVPLQTTRSVPVTTWPPVTLPVTTVATTEPTQVITTPPSTPTTSPTQPPSPVPTTKLPAPEVLPVIGCIGAGLICLKWRGSG